MVTFFKLSSPKLRSISFHSWNTYHGYNDFPLCCRLCFGFRWKCINMLLLSSYLFRFTTSLLAIFEFCSLVKKCTCQNNNTFTPDRFNASGMGLPQRYVILPLFDYASSLCLYKLFVRFDTVRFGESKAANNNCIYICSR